MGVWGVGLYSNDLTCDVRDTYINYLKLGLCDETAYNNTVEKFSDYFGDDEEALFWYALADTQWSLGRLSPEAKSKANEFIKNAENNFFDGVPQSCGWGKTLEKLKKSWNPQCKGKKSLELPCSLLTTLGMLATFMHISSIQMLQIVWAYTVNIYSFKK